jgi:hypothetical protein
LRERDRDSLCRRRLKKKTSFSKITVTLGAKSLTSSFKWHLVLFGGSFLEDPAEKT